MLYCVVRAARRGSDCRARRGLTLLEVILSLAIFLFSLVAISRLFTLGSNRAQDIQGREAQLCQSKLAEVVAGTMSVQAGSSQDGEFDEAPGWHWSVKCEANSVSTALWNVTVTVNRQYPDGSKTEAVLTQMVLNPNQRGSTLDQDPVVAANSNNPDDPNAPSSDSSSSGTPSGSGGTPATGATGAGRPATTGPTGTGRPATTGTGTQPQTPARGTTKGG
jgi:hypothetical protein